MTDTLTRLTTLLETERRALREGNLKQLVGLIDEKVSLTDELEAEGVADPAILRGLSATLKDHQTLLKAAQAGVADVLSRLAAQRRARDSLTTYDKDGRGSSIGATRGGTERRV